MYLISNFFTYTRFHCEACKQKLAIGEFSAVELEELKHSLARQLWEGHTAVKQVKCFTSAGNFIDSILPAQLDKIPMSIEQFIKKAGPYDVVIDGLNVGYSRGFFEARRVNVMFYNCLFVFFVFLLRSKHTAGLVTEIPISGDLKPGDFSFARTTSPNHQPTPPPNGPG